MRGIETGKVRIRHEVFTEIARMAYEGGDYAKRLEELPFKIIPGEIGSYRDSLFLERAVVGERLRLAMGLPLRKFSEFSLLSDGVEKALDPEIYYEKPLINVIKFACNRCPDNVVKITNVCQGCLEHPCMSVCPRQAISRQNGQAHIDPDKCIRCGRCLKECKFNAIVRLERPCRKACGMDCIHSDGSAAPTLIIPSGTSCGQCMVSCPFGRHLGQEPDLPDHSGRQERYACLRGARAGVRGAVRPRGRARADAQGVPAPRLRGRV